VFGVRSGSCGRGISQALRRLKPVVSGALVASNPAGAQLAIFSTEAAAQLHCPSDQLV